MLLDSDSKSEEVEKDYCHDNLLSTLGRGRVVGDGTELGWRWGWAGLKGEGLRGNVNYVRKRNRSVRTNLTH